MKVLKILKSRTYKNRGYRLITKQVESFGEIQNMTFYESLNGLYLSANKNLIKYFKDHGITHFETTYEDSIVANIGWSEPEQKWYGWSHRAIYSFGIGS